MLDALAFASSVDARVLPDAPPSEDMRLMVEAGILAVSQGRGAAARPIFEMIDAVQPQNAAGAIGLALIEVAQGQERNALARLRRAVLEKKNCRDEAKGVLCVLLFSLGRAHEAAPLRQELMRGPDGSARRMVAAFVAATGRR